MKNTRHIVILFLAIAILLASCRVLYDFKPIKQFDQKDYDQMITSVLDRNFKINPMSVITNNLMLTERVFKIVYGNIRLPSSQFKSSISKRTLSSPITSIARQRAVSPT